MFENLTVNNKHYSLMEEKIDRILDERSRRYVGLDTELNFNTYNTFVNTQVLEQMAVPKYLITFTVPDTQQAREAIRHMDGRLAHKMMEVEADTFRREFVNPGRPHIRGHNYTEYQMKRFESLFEGEPEDRLTGHAIQARRGGMGDPLNTRYIGRHEDIQFRGVRADFIAHDEIGDCPAIVEDKLAEPHKEDQTIKIGSKYKLVVRD